MSVGAGETLASLLPPVQEFNYAHLTHELELTIVRITPAVITTRLH